VLGQPTVVERLARLVDARAEAGVADVVLGRRETPDLARLGGDRVAEHPVNAGQRHQQRHVRVVLTEPAQLPLDRRDLVVEDADQFERRLDVRLPGLRQGRVCKPASPSRREQALDRARQPELDQGGVDPVLEPRPLLDELQPEARPPAAG
jgi:hypothetical protein